MATDDPVDDIVFLKELTNVDPASRTKLFVNITFVNVIIHVCILWTFLGIFFLPPVNPNAKWLG